MSAHVASELPGATHVPAAEHTSPQLHAAAISQLTQRPPVPSTSILNLGLEVSMARHVASLLPTATHVFGAAVPAFAHMSVLSLPVQSASAMHSTQALPVQFPLLTSMVRQVVSLLPTATQPFPDKLHLGLAGSMTKHVGSSCPMGTHLNG
jgi:hypothetical protein